LAVCQVCLSVCVKRGLWRRCLLQLAALGAALALVLHARLWWLALLFGVGMTAVAAAETVSRPAASYEARRNPVDAECAR